MLCAVCVGVRVLALCVVSDVFYDVGLFTCFVRVFCVNVCLCVWFMYKCMCCLCCIACCCMLCLLCASEV